MAELLSQEQIDEELSKISAPSYISILENENKQKCIGCKYREEIEAEYIQVVEENRCLKKLLKIYL